MNSLPTFEIVDGGIFNEKTSLLDDINYLSDVNNSIDINVVINMVLKYIFCFWDAYFIWSPIKLTQIIRFFQIANEVEATQLRRNILLWWVPEDLEGEERVMWYFYERNQYPLRMVMDIPSTVEVVLDIVSRIINPDNFEWSYVWIDLGAWSWVTTLAQDIQARRNWFRRITNIWFDISEASIHFSKEVLRRLRAWDIRFWNITSPETYKGLWLDWREITFITNETVPDPGTEMCPRDVFHDPFIQTNRVLFDQCRKNIGDNTQFFPRSIQIDRVDRSDWEVIDTLEGNKENWFLWKKLKRSRRYAYTPKSIEINWGMLPLSEVWALILKRWILRSPDIRPRWLQFSEMINVTEMRWNISV